MNAIASQSKVLLTATVMPTLIQVRLKLIDLHDVFGATNLKQDDRNKIAYLTGSRSVLQAFSHQHSARGWRLTAERQIDCAVSA